MDLPVVIVGAGPVGTSMGLLLAKMGVESVILERRATRSEHPRAHYVNTRTMELFYQWGINKSLETGAFPPECMPYNMLELMGGMTMETRQSFSPTIVQSVAQDVVEEALQGALSAYSDLCQIQWETQFEKVENSADGVTVYAKQGDKQLRYDARYLVASDGAHSAVRQQLGIEMIGDPKLDSVMNIYFHGNITKPGNQPTMGGLSHDKDIYGAFINMDGVKRACFQYLLEPGDKVEDFNFERCEDIVRRAGGFGPDHPIEIKSVRPWTMSALVAERFRDESVFLAGDAAHAFPPSGGFGLNSGVGDAHNLAWKMTAALKGEAGPDLLDSYQIERQPIAYLNTVQSFRNAKSMNLRQEEKPFNVSEATLQDIDNRANKSVRSEADPLPEGDEKQFFEMKEHGAPIGQEIGYAYLESNIIIDDGQKRSDSTISNYVPSAHPGARAPHVWLEGSDGKLSILELFKDKFTLLVGKNGEKWRNAAGASSVLNRLSTVSIGSDLDYAPESDFEALYGISDTGAVLVRPDGHVAFRKSDDTEVSAEKLEADLEIALGF